MAAAKNMAVQVIDSLSTVGFTVDHKAGAVFRAAVAFGKFLGLKKKAPHKGSIGGFQFHNVFNVLFGDQKKMHGRLGVQVFKGHELVIFVQFFRWNFPARYFTKNAVAHACIVSQIRETRNPLGACRT